MKTETIINQNILVRTYSVKEVAALYEISTKTLKKWLVPFEEEIGKRIGYFYTPKQVSIIFKNLGIPEFVAVSA